VDAQSPDLCRKHHWTTSNVDSFFRRRRSQIRALVPVRYLLDWSCCARAEALGRIHFAGAPIVVMTMTDSPYVQAGAGCCCEECGKANCKNRGMGQNCGRSGDSRGRRDWGCERRQQTGRGENARRQMGEKGSSRRGCKRSRSS